MNALSRLFATFRAAGSHERATHRTRQRHSRRPSSLIAGEALEPKQLMAVDVVNAFADQSLSTSAPVTIAITNQFDLTDVIGTVAKFETNAPLGGTAGLASNDFYVELYDKSGAAGTLTPTTVNNFLSYVNDGSYDNTMIHRSVSDFVVQGGGFTAPSLAADQPGSDPVASATKGTITNEPGNSNLRGTIAMAKLGGQPNSATSQWFINLSDNTFLDTDNGGYAVFGNVLGEGMTVVDVLGSALTYDATTYYSNSAFSDLPLWNVNADNIVLPQDFVKIETITALTDEAELMTYSVTTSDSSKLAASINAAGDLVLTPVAGQAGSVTVTVTATSKTDGSSVSDTFAVGLAGGEPEGPVDPGPLLTAIESAGLIRLNQDSDGYLYANSTPIRDTAGTHLTNTAFAGFSFVGAETVEGINYLAIRHDASNELRLWTMTTNWSKSNAPVQVFVNNSEGYLNQELDLLLDINQDGVRDGTQTSAINGDASGAQLREATDGKLYVEGHPVRDAAGNHLTKTAYLGFSFVGAETVAGTNYLAIRHDASNQLRLWTMTSEWAKSTNPVQSFDNNTDGYLQQELALHLDINQDGKRDGTIAVTITPLTSDGSGLQLGEDSSGNLYAGLAPVRDTAGNHLTKTAYAGFSFVGVETVAGTNYLAIRHDASNQLRLWTMTAGWSKSTATVQVFENNTDGYLEQEAALHLDINQDGVQDGNVAVTVTPLASDRSGIRLGEDSSGNLYAGLTPVRDTTGIHLTKTAYAGFSFVGVETVGGTNYLAIRHDASNQLRLWTMTAGWSKSTATVQLFEDNTDDFLTQEATLSLDINQDGVRNGGATSALPGDLSGVQLRVDLNGNLYAGGFAVKDTVGNHLTDTVYPGFSFVGAERIGGTNYLAIRHDASQELRLWTMTDEWTKSSDPAQLFENNTDDYLAREASLGLDVNQDGRRDGSTAVSVTPFASDTSGIQLSEDFEGKLYAGVAPIRDGAGNHLTKTAYAGFSFVGAETVGGTNYLAIRHDAWKQLRLWTMTDNWMRSGNPVQILDNNSSEYLAQEAALNLDINSDGVRDGTVAIQVTPLAADTSGIRLNKDASGYLYAGLTPIRDTAGNHLSETAYAGFSFIGVETVGGTNYLAIRHDAWLQLRLWTMTNDWTKSTTAVQLFENNTPDYLAQEIALDLDINTDGRRDGTAIEVTPLTSDTSGVQLSSDALGYLYAGLTPVRDTAGNHLFETAYAGFSFVGVETVGGTNYLAIRHDASLQLRLWTMTDSWSKSTNAVQRFENNDSGYLAQELALNLDINSDGLRDGSSVSP